VCFFQPSVTHRRSNVLQIFHSAIPYPRSDIRHIRKVDTTVVQISNQALSAYTKQLYLRFASFNKPNLCSFPKHKSDILGLSQLCCFRVVGVHLPTFRFLTLTHWDLSKRRKLLTHRQRHSPDGRNVQRNGAGGDQSWGR
jgi:hypothetical protein